MSNETTSSVTDPPWVPRRVVNVEIVCEDANWWKASLRTVLPVQSADGKRLIIEHHGRGCSAAMAVEYMLMGMIRTYNGYNGQYKADFVEALRLAEATYDSSWTGMEETGDEGLR